MKCFRSTRLFVLSAFILLLCVSGCDFIPAWETDQKLRREIFNECLKNLPAGPDETKYNDWDDVVEECGEQAYYLSRVKIN